MDPRQLSETEALVLLQQHCGVFRGRLVFDASRERGAHSKQKWMALRCLNVTTSDLRVGLGYELRVAVDVVNALCACRGFAPHRNNRFWRDAVASLWIEYTPSDTRRPRSNARPFQPLTHYMLPFDEAAFSCFTVELQTVPSLPSGWETTLTELWRQIAWVDATTKCPPVFLQSHCDVLRRIERDAVRTKRVLQLEFTLPPNARLETPWDEQQSAPASWQWSVLTATARELSARRGQLTEAMHSARQEISMGTRSGRNASGDFALHTSNLRELTTLGSSIQFLTLVGLLVNDAAASATSQILWFGELLQTLLVANKSLKYLHVDGDASVTAAICSILPVASCLEKLVIDDYVPDESAEDNHVMDWLMYALHHPLRTSANTGGFTLDLTTYDDRKPLLKDLEVLATPLEEVASRAMLNVGANLAYGVRGAIRWLDPGTAIAHVETEAELFASPDFGRGLVKTLDQGTQLEVVVIATALHAVGVVARGYGLCWVRETTVRVETRLTNELTHAPVSVQALRLSGSSWDSVASIVDALDGRQIVSLTLAFTRKSLMNGDKLALVLKRCPNLEQLTLDRCFLVSFKPLMDAYSSRARPCRLASLSLILVRPTEHNGWGFEAFAAMLGAQPEHPLRHLSVSLSTDSYASVELVAGVLAVNRSLQTVFVNAGKDYWDSERRNAWVRSLLSPFQDQVLHDARASCVALLSVLRYRGEMGGAVDAMDVVLIKKVLTFVGSTVTHTVRWLCDDGKCFPSLDDR